MTDGRWTTYPDCKPPAASDSRRHRARTRARRRNRRPRRREVDPRRARRRPSVSDRVVVDASAVSALLLDAGTDGQWVTQALAGAELAAPSVVGYETADIIRRHELAALISADQAAQAHAICSSWPSSSGRTSCSQTEPGNCAPTSRSTTPATSRWRNSWRRSSSRSTDASPARQGWGARSQPPDRTPRSRCNPCVRRRARRLGHERRSPPVLGSGCSSNQHVHIGLLAWGPPASRSNGDRSTVGTQSGVTGG